MMRADGHQASTSTVERALRRRGLLPWGFRADRKSWAALRRKVFHDPPTERNRVWQTDFSEFEAAGGGIWRICAVIGYATRYCLAAWITPTGRGVDALACLDTAVDEAERVLGLDDCGTTVANANWSTRTPRGHRRRPRSDRRRLRQQLVLSRRDLPICVRRRFFGTLKYEHLDRAPIDDGGALRWRPPASATSTTASGHTKLSTIGTPRQAYLDT